MNEVEAANDSPHAGRRGCEESIKRVGGSNARTAVRAGGRARRERRGGARARVYVLRVAYDSEGAGVSTPGRRAAARGRGRARRAGRDEHYT